MSGPLNIDELIDAYVDGELSPDEARQMEARLEADPALRRQVDVQRRAEARLRALLTVPACPGLQPDAPVQEAVPASMQPARTRRPFAQRAFVRLAAAVALIGVLGIAWAGWNGSLNGLWHAVFSPAASDLTADTIVKRYEADGFVPAEICTSPELVATYTREHLGREVEFTLGPGVELVGWHYSGGILAEQAVALMARNHGEPVVVFIGPSTGDRRVRLEANTTYHLHRAEQGGLVFYEVSRAPEASVVSGIRVK